MSVSSKESRAMRVLGFGLGLTILSAIIFALVYFVAMPIWQKSQVAATSSGVKYDHQVTLCLDSFAGYAPLRSAYFRDRLGDSQIGLTVEDDGADYMARAKNLRSDRCNAAVMTIDADLVTGQSLNEYPEVVTPGTIVWVLDQTKGADGIVTFKDVIPNVGALNRSDARIYATADSPSETLARHLKSGMLPELPNNNKWLEPQGSVDEVVKQIKKADRTMPYAYALWEPELSKAVAQYDMVVIYDSSHAPGIIVDVLVFSRDYMKNHPDKVQKIVEAYAKTLAYYEGSSGGMASLIMEDARLINADFDESDASRIASRIQWFNVTENYALFGLLPRYEAGGLQSLDQMIDTIADRVLVRTGKLSEHPAKGRTHELYFDAVLRQMKAEQFHPGMGGVGSVRGNTELPALNPAEWGQLVVIGDLDATEIQFRRASAELSDQGKRDVSEIADQLRGFPTYYITVIGNTADKGDPDANRQLALQRADAVKAQLTSRGVSGNRVRTIAGDSTNGSAGQKVTFELAQQSY